MYILSSDHRSKRNKNINNFNDERSDRNHWYGVSFSWANDLSEFWQVNRDGIDTITEASSDRPTEMTGWGGFLKGIEKFDAAFFGISPEEAIKIDPTQQYCRSGS